MLGSEFSPANQRREAYALGGVLRAKGGEGICPFDSASAARLHLAHVGNQLAVELGRVMLARGAPHKALQHMKNGSGSFGKSRHELLFAEALIPLFDAALQCEDSTLATAVARRFEERAPHMEGL